MTRTHTREPYAPGHLSYGFIDHGNVYTRNCRMCGEEFSSTVPAQRECSPACARKREREYKKKYRRRYKRERG
jgi:hypothetical protein